MLQLVFGAILTMNPRRPRAEWMVTHGEYIVLVGSGEPPGLTFERRLDFRGYTVLPGFNDAHNHLLNYGFKLGEIDLRGVCDIVDLAARVSRFDPGLAIVRASGYNQALLREKRHPTLAELDGMVPDRPLVIAHTSGHMLAVNSHALTLARIGPDTEDPPGGVIERDRHGRPSGLLLERAQELMTAALPVPTLDQMVEAIGRASKRYASWGLTTTQEAGVGWLAENEIAAWQDACERGVLKTRAVLMPDVRSMVWEEGRPLMYQGMRTGFGGTRLRLGPVKIFADGSMIGRTAAMTEPYAGTDQRGMLIWDPDRLRAMVSGLVSQGFRVAVHAIGDRAVEAVLDAYQAAARDRDIRPMRNRIEHAGVLPDALLSRCVQLGVLPIPQQHFIGELGDTFRQNIGDRIKHSYRQKSILDAGLVLAGSSDCFVVDGRPLLGIHDAVNQRTATGQPYAPEEALTAGQALAAYTSGSAYAGKEEEYKGRLQSGFLADFTVLDRNPLEVDSSSIRDIRVIATYCGGEKTYSA